MPRILLLLDTTGPGGAETVFVELATRLASEGFDAHPVVQGPGWVADRLVAAGLEPETVASERRVDLAYVRKLARLIERRRVDLVHAHLASTALYGSLAARLCGVPALATFHGEPELGGGSPADAVRYALIRACNHRVVLVSEALRRETVRRGLLLPHETAVVYNGVAAEEFAAAEPLDLRAAHELPRDAFLVGSVGNLRPLKDYPTLVRAAARLRALERRPFHFFVAGEGTAAARQELLDLAARSGVADRIHLLGFRDDVPRILASVDAFLLASTSEGFSIATIQAMAAGLPVVVTRSGGPEEIVTDGVHGLLVRPREPGEMARALDVLERDPALRARLADAGRRTVTSRFSIEAMISGYAKLYRSALGDRSVRGRTS